MDLINDYNILHKILNEALEGKFTDDKLVRLLVETDLTKGTRNWRMMVDLLSASCRMQNDQNYCGFGYLM